MEQPLSHIRWHKCHRVIAENADHFNGDGVAASTVIGILVGGELEISALPCTEALPFVLEDRAAGPALFDIGKRKSGLRGLNDAEHADVPRVSPRLDLVADSRHEKSNDFLISNTS